MAASSGSAALAGPAGLSPTPCRSRDRLFRHRRGPCPSAGRDKCRRTYCHRARSRRWSTSHALSTCLLDPVVGPAGRIPAVPHLGDDALKTGLAGMLVHLAAIDLEALTE